MKARKLLSETTYDADTLGIIFKAFDEAWAEIEHHFNEELRAEARSKLAHAILVVVDLDNTDVHRLKQGALQVMALAYNRNVTEPHGTSDISREFNGGTSNRRTPMPDNNRENQQGGQNDQQRGGQQGGQGGRQDQQNQQDKNKQGQQNPAQQQGGRDNERQR